MLDKVKATDTTAIKSLVKLKQEKKTVAAFLEQADSLTAKVDSPLCKSGKIRRQFRLG